MLTVITGPMFSGKSSALISRCIANVIAERYVVVFKPDNDDRYDKKLVNVISHNGDAFPAVAVPTQDPGLCWDAIYSLNKSVNVIAFDEAQFFEKGAMLDIVKELMDEGFDIILAGLSQDYIGRPFGAMPELLAVADEILSLKAVCSNCKCIGVATRTYRKSKDDEQVVVGGTDKYEARCYTCWSKSNEV